MRAFLLVLLSWCAMSQPLFPVFTSNHQPGLPPPLGSFLAGFGFWNVSSNTVTSSELPHANSRFNDVSPLLAYDPVTRFLAYSGQNLLRVVDTTSGDHVASFSYTNLFSVYPSSPRPLFLPNGTIALLGFNPQDLLLFGTLTEDFRLDQAYVLDVMAPRWNHQKSLQGGFSFTGGFLWTTLWDTSVHSLVIACFTLHADGYARLCGNQALVPVSHSLGFRLLHTGRALTYNQSTMQIIDLSTGIDTFTASYGHQWRLICNDLFTAIQMAPVALKKNQSQAYWTGICAVGANLVLVMSHANFDLGTITTTQNQELLDVLWWFDAADGMSVPPPSHTTTGVMATSTAAPGTTLATTLRGTTAPPTAVHTGTQLPTTLPPDHTATIAGVVTAGVVILVVLIVLIWWIRKKRQSYRKLGE